MRPSSRTQILEAAIRVTEKEGITSLTLESVAVEAGLTKGGLLYHFRTREELLLAIQRHLTEGWEKQLEARLGKAFAEATAAERAIAYTLMDVDSEPRKADLAFMVESASDPELAQVWNALVDRWVPVPSEPDPAQLELFLARMAADGLWLFEATTGTELTPAVKDALRQRIAALTESASAP
ncbi:TetR/AcrR family transcriptional regulator [Streptomyces phaeochromogenes]|uniref:TetR/AcrR family transcriptional regulator n=1 Tax=Streptomyces phaeochromogenes TaxID=1923 RepID=UPI002DD7A9E4|nr:TetR/AcrR family transcriptional regulator [Streptomyces phaeochromogenes]WRZ28627.1 TetR/AcrR family transcriptional regulator [Streptomyces phaeochromogenes]